MLQESLSQLEIANSTSGANRIAAAGSLFATKVRERGASKLLAFLATAKWSRPGGNPKRRAAFGMDLYARESVCRARPERSFQQAENVSGTRVASPAGNKTCLPKPKRKEQVAWEDSAAQGNLRSHSDRFYCERRR